MPAPKLGSSATGGSGGKGLRSWTGARKQAAISNSFIGASNRSGGAGNTQSVVDSQAQAELTNASDTDRWTNPKGGPSAGAEKPLKFDFEIHSGTTVENWTVKPTPRQGRLVSRILARVRRARGGLPGRDAPDFPFPPRFSTMTGDDSASSVGDRRGGRRPGPALPLFGLPAAQPRAAADPAPHREDPGRLHRLRRDQGRRGGAAPPDQRAGRAALRPVLVERRGALVPHGNGALYGRPGTPPDADQGGERLEGRRRGGRDAPLLSARRHRRAPGRPSRSGDRSHDVLRRHLRPRRISLLRERAGGGDLRFGSPASLRGARRAGRGGAVCRRPVAGAAGRRRGGDRRRPEGAPVPDLDPQRKAGGVGHGLGLLGPGGSRPDPDGRGDLHRPERATGRSHSRVDRRGRRVPRRVDPRLVLDGLQLPYR